MSKHEIPVVRIGKIEDHPNADKLQITRVFGYTVVIGKGQFKEGDFGVYIPPDYEVPTNLPEFAFLAKEGQTHHRIRVSKRRGVISQGLLIPAPPVVQQRHLSSEELETEVWRDPEALVYIREGLNLINYYGIIRYEPKEPLSMGGEDEEGPEGFYPKYDVENFLRYNNIIKPGEEVLIREKIHGASGRFCYRNDRMYCGSRTTWKKLDNDNMWWKCLNQNPWIQDFCKRYPELTVYGEVYGKQNLKYGLSGNQIGFAAFDLLKGNQWLSWEEILKDAIDRELRWAPLLYEGPFDPALALELAEGDSSIPGANHYREGVVVRPIKERTDIQIGRVQLKIVGNRYLEKD